jgi:hypothetical protein
MAQLSPKLRSIGGDGYRGIMHWCPACSEGHVFYIQNPKGRPVWVWNGSIDRPTCTPSMRIFMTDDEDENGKPLPKPVERTICHYFLTDGQIAYCGDSAHPLAGATVPLPDIPSTWGGGED